MALTNPKATVSRAVEALSSFGLVSLFLALIWLPAVLTVVGVSARSVENRELTGPPSFDLTAVLSSDYWSQWDAFLTDGFPLRTQAIELKTSFGRLIGDLGSSQVIAGRSGWLYFWEDFERACSADANVDDAVARVREVRKDFERNGTRLIVIIAPDKAEIVQEPLSQAQMRRHRCGAARLVDLRTQLTAVLGGDHIDAFKVLSRSSAPEGLYYRFDTHWRDEGAVLALRELYDRVAPGRWEERTVVKLSGSEIEGDLSRMLGSPRRELAVSLGFVPELTFEFVFDERQGGGGHYRVRQVGGDAPFEKVVVVYDSFFWGFDGSGIPWFVAGLGRDTTFVPWWPLSPEEWESLTEILSGADLVIFESVSRAAIEVLVAAPSPKRVGE